MNYWIVILKCKILIIFFVVFCCGLDIEDTTLGSPWNSKMQSNSDLYPFIEFSVKNGEKDFAPKDSEKILRGYIIYYKKHNENEKRICQIFNSEYEVTIDSRDIDLSVRKEKIFSVNTGNTTDDDDDDDNNDDNNDDDDNNSSLTIGWVNKERFFDSERVIRAYFHDFSQINNNVVIENSAVQPPHPWYETGTGKNVYMDNLFPHKDDAAYDENILNFEGFLDQQYFDNISGNQDKYKITFYASAFGYDQFQDKFIESNHLTIGTIDFYESYLKNN